MLLNVFTINTQAAITLPPTTATIHCDGGYLFLPAGTSVSLELNQAINSEEVEVGHTVRMRVRSNVVVNNRVVIRAGSYATGKVSKVNKSANACDACDNICSSVTIVPEKAAAVDGNQVYLEGSPHVARGGCMGTGAAMITIGTSLDATVRDNVKIML